MASELDAQLMRTLTQLLRKLESYLPKNYGVMTWCYNRIGAELDIVSFASNEQSTAETLRIIRSTATKLIQRDAKAGTIGEERYFDAPAVAESPSQLLVSSAAVTRHGGHDRVRIWSRGALTGELVLEAGDGARFATEALMLEERA